MEHQTASDMVSILYAVGGYCCVWCHVELTIDTAYVSRDGYIVCEAHKGLSKYATPQLNIDCERMHKVQQ